MNRRDLLGLSLAAVGGVFAPRFGRWYREPPRIVVPTLEVLLDGRVVARIPEGTGLVRIDLGVPTAPNSHVEYRWVGVPPVPQSQGAGWINYDVRTGPYQYVTRVEMPVMVGRAPRRDTVGPVFTLWP